MDGGGSSGWHSKHSCGAWHGHVLFDGRTRCSPAGIAICGNRSYGILSHARRRQDADLGVSAILSNAVLGLLIKGEQRWFYLASFLMLILFVAIYSRWSKPTNRLQTEAAKTGQPLDNGRELQTAWDRVLLVRVPLLVLSLFAQCLALLAASA